MNDKVLIIDDDENMTKLLNVVLKTEFSLSISHSAEEALSLFKDQGFDAIVLDLNMPGKTGLDMIREVRGSEENKWLPIIVLSGKEKSEDRITSLEAGADDYLMKPFNPVELKLRLKRAVERYKLIRSR